MLKLGYPELCHNQLDCFCFEFGWGWTKPIILDPKKCCVWNIVWVKKNVVSNFFLGLKKFWSDFYIKKNCPKFYWVKKNLGRKFYRVKKNCVGDFIGLKKWVWNFIGLKKLGRKFGLAKFYFGLIRSVCDLLLITAKLNNNNTEFVWWVVGGLQPII